LANGSVRALAHSLASTRASNALREHLWIVPTSQSIHIIGVALVFTSALIISLRLIGLGRSEQPLSIQISRLARMLFFSVPVLLVTGVLQTIAEPVRQLVTPAFWLKMALILIGLGMVYFLAESVRRDPHRWESPETRPPWSRIYAVVNLGIWITVILCGRFIGYTWMKYV